MKLVRLWMIVEVGRIDCEGNCGRLTNHESSHGINIHMTIAFGKHYVQKDMLRGVRA